MFDVSDFPDCQSMCLLFFSFWDQEGLNDSDAYGDRLVVLRYFYTHIRLGLVFVQIHDDA